MKRLMHTLWLTAAAALLLLAPVAAAPAQELKPLAVVSIAPVDKLLGDVDYLTKAGGAADAGRLATLLVGPFIDGVDRTKAAGGYVTLDGDKPVGIGFVPTKDLTKILATVKDQIGEPKDVGDGVQQLGDGEIYVKLEGSYTFISNDPANLTTLPKDPAALLAGLDKIYSVAVKVNSQNIPQMFKDQMIAEMEKGFADAPIGDDADPAQKELRDKIGRNTLDQLISLINDSNEITMGWAVDPASKSTYMDVLFTAVPGTKLAKQMAILKDAKTDFSGFLRPDAAMTWLSATKMTDKDEIGRSLALLDGGRAAFLKEIEKEDLDEGELAATKKLINSLMDVLSATVKEGKSDGGALVIAEPNALTIAVGGYVVDAAKLEASLKEAVKYVQDNSPEELENAEIKFDSGKHGGIRFHNVKYTLQDDEMKKVFGDELDVVVGVGDKAFYVALGAKPEETLKKIIDDSAASPGKAVLPGQMSISVGPFVKFVDSIEPNPVTAMLMDVVDRVKGNDKVLVTITAVPNGEKVRFSLEEGILQIIGEGAKAAQGAAGGGAF